PLREAPERINPSMGIWNYLHPEAFGASAEVISLGEGLTPLVWSSVGDKDRRPVEVCFKCEHFNPTGSFKDRGSAACVQFLVNRGIDTVYEDSSGNAGASLAAYASRAGLEAHIYVPSSVSGAKRAQISQFGAQLHLVEGPRSRVTEALYRDLRGKSIASIVYASHAWMPFHLIGYATLALELFDQLGGAPGSILLPVGQGGLLLGVASGFEWLRMRGKIEVMPQIYGVQARACAPLWAVYSYGRAGLSWVVEGETLAEGIRIKYPIRGDAVLEAVEKSGGSFFAVDEEEIIEGMKIATQMGFLVEPTSAVVFPVLLNYVEIMRQPVVVILSGSGYKALEQYEAQSSH
ncbi:MAG: pyridoxal-phosphate dependent enzyme, partial [Anaerolineales bacterium]|nr:pyridoxal-phosphate dependent enzyme [Anaerolineales bacterium]MDW8446417.1 pyridoxal-phosphate dependent enzyme [Anaerolineales bacterium]